jgi:hypothetical protein
MSSFIAYNRFEKKLPDLTTKAPFNPLGKFLDTL